MTRPDATAWVQERHRETINSLEAAGVTSTFAARLRHRRNTDWESTVIIDAAGGETEPDIALCCTPGNGIVLITRNDPTALQHIAVQNNGEAVWVETNACFTPNTISPEGQRSLTDLINHIAAAPNEPALRATTAETVDDSDEGTVDLRDRENRVVEMADTPHLDYEILVRVVGEIQIDGSPERLTDAETEVVVILAVLGKDGPINLDRLATLVARDEWRTPQLRSVQARISHIRRKIGYSPNGWGAYLPDCRTNPTDITRYQMSKRVATDIDIINHAYQTADLCSSNQAIHLLRNALELVRGKPFTAPAGYSWAYDGHAAASAEQAISDAAGRLIELYGQAGDIAGILWTINQAKRGIDNPITEMPHRLITKIWATRLNDPALNCAVAQFESDVAKAFDTTDADAEILN